MINFLILYNIFKILKKNKIILLFFGLCVCKLILIWDNEIFLQEILEDEKFLQEILKKNSEIDLQEILEDEKFLQEILKKNSEIDLQEILEKDKQEILEKNDEIFKISSNQILKYPYKSSIFNFKNLDENKLLFESKILPKTIIEIIEIEEIDEEIKQIPTISDLKDEDDTCKTV